MTESEKSKLSDLNKTADTTAEYDAKDIEQNKVLSLFAYLGILFLIPLLAAKDSKFARFHTNQGLVLFIAAIAWSVVYSILTTVLGFILLSGAAGLYSLIVMLLGLIYLVFTVLAIIGIVNALTGKAKELPIIGKFKLLK